jgi:drug/metabolite transporter (DMT)-like permease
LSSALLFAVLAGAAAATWTVCLKLGSTKISATLGAMVVSGIALVANTVAFALMRAGGHQVVFRKEAFWLLVIAGLGASGVDIFALLAYERGLRVTSSLILSGTSTALVLIVGFLALQEPFTWGRLAALALIVAGMLLYQVQGG